MSVRHFGLIGKMSPRGNIEGDSESNSEKNEIQVSNIQNHKSSLNLNFNIRSPLRNNGNKENSNFNINNNERMDMTSQINI